MCLLTLIQLVGIEFTTYTLSGLRNFVKNSWGLKYIKEKCINAYI